MMMTTNEKLILLHFLEEYAEQLLKTKKKNLNPIFKKYLSKKDMIDILESSWFEQNLAEHQIEMLDSSNLFELIGEDYFILTYFIEKIKNSINKVPSLSQSSVDEFFESRGLEMHYLAFKPAVSWDEYDLSNYYSLLFKRGVTKRVFAIFTSDVEEKDKYIVTTKPSFFFDSKEEAEDELHKMLLDGSYMGELKIMSLWHIK